MAKQSSRGLFSIMANENDVQGRKHKALYEEVVDGHPYGLMILDVSPESGFEYDVTVSEENRCRELARLNFRTCIFPYSAINQAYLRSTLPLYDDLILLIEDEEVREVAEDFRRHVSDSLGRFAKMDEDFRRRVGR